MKGHNKRLRGQTIVKTVTILNRTGRNPSFETGQWLTKVINNTKDRLTKRNTIITFQNGDGMIRLIPLPGGCSQQQLLSKLTNGAQSVTSSLLRKKEKEKKKKRKEKKNEKRK